MVKNLVAIKTYPLGIHRNCTHNEYSSEEHPHLLKELNILWNFNRSSCGEWKKCFSARGFLNILSKGSYSVTPSGVGSKGVCLAHLHVLTKCHDCLSKVVVPLPQKELPALGQPDFCTKVAFCASNLQDGLGAPGFQHPAVQNWLAKIFRQQITLRIISYILRIKCLRKGKEMILDVMNFFIEYPELQNKCWKKESVNDKRNKKQTWF